MTPQPLPPGMGAHLAQLSANPSLHFDRAFDGFAPAFDKFGSDAVYSKQGFLARFAERAPSPDQRRYFEERLARRKAALGDRAPAEGDSGLFHTHAFELINATRLVLGLGLPNSVETGFLFDRLTGCPFIPGSSLKGLARAAARQVVRGEIDGDRAFWQDHLKRLFGPPDTGVASKTGEAIFYDAFPEKWPELVVDLLNPHYTKHLEDQAQPPADWHNPIPVPFLAIEVGTRFEIHLGLRGPQGPKAVAADHQDLVQLIALLQSACDDLGAGAKTSSGYGYLTVPGLGEVAGALPIEADPPPDPVEHPPSILDVKLQRKGSYILAYRGKKADYKELFKVLKLQAPLKNLSKGAQRQLKSGELRAKIAVIGERIDSVLEIYE